MLIENSLIPLHVLHPKETIPQEWIDSNNSMFIQQGQQVFNLIQNPLYSLLVPTEKNEELLKTYYKDTYYKNDEAVILKNNLNGFTFSAEDFAYVMRYLQWIYDEYKSEGALILLVHMERREWKPFFVVQGCASGGAVSYVMPTNGDKGLLEHVKNHEKAKGIHDAIVEKYQALHEDGWRIFGTIHSHCNFSAYHSGVDDADEVNFDGLHITIGNVRSNWSYSARFMIRGYEFKLDLPEFLGSDICSIENMVDNVELDPFHQTLMITDLIPKPVIKTFPKAQNLLTRLPWINNSYTDHNDETYEEEYAKIKGLFDQDEDDDNEDFDQEFNENVFNADDVVYLRHSTNGHELIVKTEYYYENFDTLFVNYNQVTPNFVDWE